MKILRNRGLCAVVLFGIGACSNDGVEGSAPDASGPDGGCTRCDAAPPPETCEMGEWRLSYASTAGGNSSIDLDGAGRAHVLYSNADLLLYRSQSDQGHFFGAGSAVAEVGAVGDLGGWNADSAVDDSGGVHVAYANRDDETLTYAYRPPGGAFVTSPLDSGELVGVPARVAVDTSGGVHVAYNDHDAQQVHYARGRPGESFDVVPLSSASTGASLAVAVDGEDGAHFVYRAADGLVYQDHAAGEIDLLEEGGIGPSIALDSDGGAHVSYARPASIQPEVTSGVKYAHRAPDGALLVEELDAAATDADTAIALDQGGGVHIAYSRDDAEEMTSMLQYARLLPGGTFDIRTVEAGAVDVRTPSIAVDDEGGVHISYTFGSSVRYAYAAACTAQQ